jgi:hypothetical protein
LDPLTSVGCSEIESLSNNSFAEVKFFIFIGTNIGASVGWAAGERYGLMTAFIVSGLGSALGVYAGWWAARRWL